MQYANAGADVFGDLIERDYQSAQLAEVLHRGGVGMTRGGGHAGALFEEMFGDALAGESAAKNQYVGARDRWRVVGFR